MKLFLSIIIFLSINNKLLAQEKCPVQRIFRTDKVGDSLNISGGIKMPLNFIISTDSIIVSRDTSGKMRFLAFRILRKECFWDGSPSDGKSVYSLMSGEAGRPPAYPELTIFYKKSDFDYIKILYENKQQRFFYLISK